MALSQTRENGLYACEYRWKCADDQFRYFLDQGVLAPSEEGAEPEIFGTLIDVSDRRELEQKLLQSSKLEAIGRLTGGVAHDFNNMLAVVMGNLQLLQKAIPDNDSARRRIAMATEAARRCADLTSRLLAFSRRQRLQALSIDVFELVEGMLEILARSLGERIQIECSMPDDVWPVLADRSQLENVLLNRAIDGRDAMPDGGQLTISLVPDVLAAKWMKLVVNAMCLGPFAMLGLPVQEATDLPGMRELILRIGAEALEAGQALGHAVRPIMGLKEEDVRGSNQLLEKLVDKVYRDLGPRARDCVLQDHLKGRYSEVVLINGLVVDEAARRGRQAPANAAIVEITRRIRSGQLKPEPSNFALVRSMLD